MSFSGFFFGRNRKSNNGRSTSCDKLRCNSVRTRTLFMEPLETRDLLSVTTGMSDNAEYAEIRVQYPDFNLPKLQADLNVMTITPDDGACPLPTSNPPSPTLVRLKSPT